MSPKNVEIVKIVVSGTIAVAAVTIAKRTISQSVQILAAMSK